MKGAFAMSDFMKWLHEHYIKPYLDTVPVGDYSFHMDMIHNELGYHALESYEKNLEFTASGRVTSSARASLPARAARFPNIPSRSLDTYMEALNG